MPVGHAHRGGPCGGRPWQRPVPAIGDRNSQGQLNVTYFVTATSHVTEYLTQPGRHTRTRPLGSPFDPGCGLTVGVKHIPWISDYQALASTAGHPCAAWNDGGTGLEILVERVPPTSHP